MNTFYTPKNGEASWWLGVYQLTVAGIRQNGLPSKNDGLLAIEVPDLMTQATQMRRKTRPIVQYKTALQG